MPLHHSRGRRPGLGGRRSHVLLASELARACPHTHRPKRRQTNSARVWRGPQPHRRQGPRARAAAAAARGSGRCRRRRRRRGSGVCGGRSRFKTLGGGGGGAALVLGCEVREDWGAKVVALGAVQGREKRCESF